MLPERGPRSRTATSVSMRLATSQDKMCLFMVRHCITSCSKGRATLGRFRCGGLCDTNQRLQGLQRPSSPHSSLYPILHDYNVCVSEVPVHIPQCSNQLDYWQADRLRRSLSLFISPCCAMVNVSPHATFCAAPVIQVSQIDPISSTIL